MTYRPHDSTGEMDSQSQDFLNLLADHEKLKANRVAGVRTVLVVLSSRGMVFDTEALRQKIFLSYPDSAVFFITTMGKAVGAEAPKQVDLLIDFTGPGQRQGWFFPKKLRRLARVTVGRNAGLFRKRIYDRVYDEKKVELPSDPLTRERYVQRAVLASVGIPLTQSGDTLPDRSKTIALELPLMAKL